MLDEQPTGVGVYSFNVINHLSGLYSRDNRKSVTVFTPSEANLNKGMQIVKLSRLLQSSRYGKVAAICRVLWNTFLYPLQARRFDLVLSPTTHGSFINSNQVLTIHDLLSLRFNNISFHQRLYFKVLLPFLVKRSKMIITVSESTKTDIVKFLQCAPEKVHVIYNGYEHTRYYITQSADQPFYKRYGISNYLLAVGPTYPHKNFEALIDAYSQLPAKWQQQHPLVIAGGKKPYLLQLKEYILGKSCSAHIHFVGYVPIELMAAMYREAVALIFPSLYEGFGIPLLEAMACGCPVLTSNISSMPEVCGEAALYFDPLNTSSIYDAVLKILENGDGLRHQLSQKGLIRVQQFSWEKTAQQIKSLLDLHFQKP